MSDLNLLVVVELDLVAGWHIYAGTEDYRECIRSCSWHPNT
jgi:hypothetical protein